MPHFSSIILEMFFFKFTELSVAPLIVERQERRKKNYEHYYATGMIK